MKDKIKLNIHTNLALLAVLGAWLIVYMMVTHINELTGSMPMKFTVSKVDSRDFLLNGYTVKDANGVEYVLGSRREYNEGDEVLAWKNMRTDVHEADKFKVYDVTKIELTYVLGIVMLVSQVAAILVSLWDCNWRKKK